MDEDAIFELLSELNTILNYIAMFCASIVVILIIVFTMLEPVVMNRLSIRFTLVISVVDFFKALLIIFYNGYQEDDIFCKLFAFGILWLTLLYMFLNVMIAVNLYLVFIKCKPFNHRWEIIYWITSFSGATILLLPPLIFGKLGLDEQTGSCHFRDLDTVKSQLWIWITFLFWIVASCFYCGWIVFMTILNLRKKVSIVNKLSISDSKSLTCPKVQGDLKMLIRRVALYCIIPTITQAGLVWIYIHEYFIGPPHVVFYFISVIGTDLPGILNFIAFLLDPAFYNVSRLTIKNLKAKSGAKYLYQSPESDFQKNNNLNIYPISRNDSLSNRCQDNRDESNTINARISEEYLLKPLKDCSKRLQSDFPNLGVPESSTTSNSNNSNTTLARSRESVSHFVKGL